LPFDHGMEHINPTRQKQKNNTSRKNAFTNQSGFLLWVTAFTKASAIGCTQRYSEPTA